MLKHDIQHTIDSVIDMLFSKIEVFIFKIHLSTVSAIIMNLIYPLYKFRATT